MTIASIIKSVRVWGIKGVLDYLHRLPVLRRLAHSDKHGYETPERGITLIGPFSIPNGLSQCMRHFATRLAEAGIPHQTFDTCDRHALPPADYAHLLTPADQFDLSRYDHVIEIFTSHAPQAKTRLHSLLTFWEFESGLSYAVPEILSGASLIGMSDFNVTLLKKESRPHTPVFKIRYPLVLDNKAYTPRNEIRRSYGIPDDAFMVFFNFDYGSSFYRKNPEAVVQAFAKAFPQRNENAVLVLKTPRPREPYAGYLHREIAACGLEDRTVLVECAISQPDMTGLIAACDCYISLHRGEGFGIGMAEAMSHGKPVIATDYSANTEFCTPDCTFPIPYKMVPVAPEQHDIAAYAKVESWADPDVGAAAYALRKLYDDPTLRSEISAKARHFINDYFSVANFKADVERFLDSH